MRSLFFLSLKRLTTGELLTFLNKIAKQFSYVQLLYCKATRTCLSEEYFDMKPVRS